MLSQYELLQFGIISETKNEVIIIEKGCLTIDSLLVIYDLLKQQQQ